MVRDIREGPTEEYWDRLRQLMGPDGLITYWHLGRAFNQAEDPDTMRLRHDMRNSGGGIMAAPLAIAAPETGGWRDREVIPAPVTYALHIIDDARDVTEIRVSRTTVRRGGRMGFSRSEITDAANPSRLIAVTTGVGVKLGDAPPSFRPVEAPPDTPEVDDLPPLHVVFGARRDADGWRLPALTSRLASTSASLHLGPIHVGFEAAAAELAAELAGSDSVQVEDWDVHFVAPGRTGPFLVRADGWAGQGGRVAVRFTLVDEGRDGAVVAAGAATYRRSEP
jgi:acyl-coenzyme A thioesterase PaaI-like protein